MKYNSEPNQLQEFTIPMTPRNWWLNMNTTYANAMQKEEKSYVIFVIEINANSLIHNRFNFWLKIQESAQNSNTSILRLIIIKKITLKYSDSKMKSFFVFNTQIQCSKFIRLQLMPNLLQRSKHKTPIHKVKCQNKMVYPLFSNSPTICRRKIPHPLL